MSEQIIVIPYRKSKGRFVQQEIRQASSPAGAERIAERILVRYDGVATYAVTVDDDSGYLESPRLLAQYGTVPALENYAG